MSIADKITSIEEHLTDDYEGLENLGADLTNVNKNIQNIRTCLDNIYSSLPKTTGEGSNLSLSPTLKGKLNIEAYKGDTSQDGTPTPSNIEDIEVVTGTQEVVVSNKNLCNVNFNSITIAGVTLTKNSDNSITANGTAASVIAVNILNNNGGTAIDNLTLPKGTYTLSGCPTRWWY